LGQVSTSAAYAPVTIGNLRQTGKALEIGCLNCDRHGYWDATTLPLPDALPVPDVAARLRCSQCGYKNGPTGGRVWARPDARV